jgi:DNA-binding NarL/FixJ family response regulator
VLTCVGRGLSTKEIATALNMSVKTADRHRTNLMAKLGIHDRVQLALCAVREGLVRA